MKITLYLFVTFLLVSQATGCANLGVNSRILLIEQDIHNKKYNDAEQRINLDMVFRRIIWTDPDTGKKLSGRQAVRMCIKTMKRLDRLEDNIKAAQVNNLETGRWKGRISKIKNSRSGYNNTITLTWAIEDAPRVMPFSVGFVDAMNKRIDSVREKEKTLYRTVENETEKRKDIKLAKKNQQIKEKNQQEAAKQAAINKEKSRLRQAASSRGLNDWFDLSVIQLILKTQAQGGLDQYVNGVFGCAKNDTSQCNKYQYVRSIQVLDKHVIYSYRSFTNGHYSNFYMMIEKRAGTLYQKNEALREKSLIFTGMREYTGVLGQPQTVPNFKPIDI